MSHPSLKLPRLTVVSWCIALASPSGPSQHYIHSSSKEYYHTWIMTLWFQLSQPISLQNRNSLQDRNKVTFIFLSSMPNTVDVQSLSCVPLFATPWTAAHQASLSSTISQSLLSLESTDAIQSSLLSPSPPALNFSQHQSLFPQVGSSHQVVKVLELQLQHQSFQWILRVVKIHASVVSDSLQSFGM